METTGLRSCANIKSKRHRDARCTAIATYGDFCTRHYKNPTRFTPSPYRSAVALDRVFTRSEYKAARSIQVFWRSRSALMRYRQQGPGANMKDYCSNASEVYNLEPLIQIPQVYFFSFADDKKNIWGFDIRSLSHLITTSVDVHNPYTREPINSATLANIHKRFTWLRKRKYAILYCSENLTQEQIWNQKVLDVFFKMEALGYRASYQWFDEMNISAHERFYSILYRLWTYELGISPQEKESLVPGYNSGSTKLFRKVPDGVSGGLFDLRWWRKNNLSVIVSLLTRAPQKNQQALGALYILMSLVRVVPEAAEAYPWILDTFRGAH